MIVTSGSQRSLRGAGRGETGHRARHKEENVWSRCRCFHVSLMKDVLAAVASEDNIQRREEISGRVRRGPRGERRGEVSGLGK